MRLALTLLPVAATAVTAFVLPDDDALRALPFEIKKQDAITTNGDYVWSEVQDRVQNAAGLYAQSDLDKAFEGDRSEAMLHECMDSMTKFDGKAWVDSELTMPSPSADWDTIEEIERMEAAAELEREDSEGQEDEEDYFGQPHHPVKSNQTLYELIAGSKYTTTLAKLIGEFPDLVDLLNSTEANYTVFVPTNEAFAKLPKHHKPSKEVIKQVLQYHILEDNYPVPRLGFLHTAPTTLKEERLGGEAQRLRVDIGLGGLKINFFSTVVASNIFGANGIIHGLDTVLLPPPKITKIIQLIPTEFSTLELALIKSDLHAVPHEGATFFAPNNGAWKKLGPRINAFLFSPAGTKYLTALLQYHIVANQTFYSDAFYKAKATASEAQFGQFDISDIPKGHFHLDLPTLLPNRSLSIDIARWVRFILVKINGFSSIGVMDGLAQDGVIHMLRSILIPPKTPGGAAVEAEELMDDVEEFKARFSPYVARTEEMVDEL